MPENLINKPGLYATTDIQHDLDDSLFTEIFTIISNSITKLLANLLEEYAANLINIDMPISWHEGMLDAASIIKSAELTTKSPFIEHNYNNSIET